MKNKCYSCTHKFTATHHDDESVTFCNFEVDNNGCDKYEIKKDCKYCRHLDYSNLKICHHADGYKHNAGWGYVCDNWNQN